MMGLSVAVALALTTGQVWLGILAGGLIEWAGRRPLPAIGWLSGAVVVAAGLAWWMGGSLEAVLAAGLAWFVVHQRSTAQRPATDVLLVGLLLVVCATRTRSPWFGLALLSWVAGLAPTLGAPGWVGLPLVGVALPVFLLTPRFVPSDLRERDARGLTGFSADVELGSMQDLLDDPSRVFEATFDQPLTAPPYFRGVALDRFDGRRWWSEAKRTREPAYGGGLADAVRLDVKLEAHTESVLFVPGTVDGVDGDGLAIERDAGGAYHFPGPPRALTYTAWVRPPFGPGRMDPFQDAAPRLDLPELSTEVRTLFRGVVEGVEGPTARMDTLSDWLRTSYAYTRAPRDLDVEAPLDRFLLDTREGHCEYFASALAVAGRVAGVPTRLVNGFVGGDPVSDQVVVVRRYHAHSWVEYFDGEQWITIDPTPPVLAPTGPGLLTRSSEELARWWDDLVGYDGEQQVHAARDIASVMVPNASPLTGALVGSSVIGLAVGLLVLLVRRILVRVADPVAAAVAVDPITAMVVEARELLVLRGWHAPEHLPDVAFGEWVAEREPAVGELLVALAWLAYGVRFGGRAAGACQEEASSLLDRLREVA